MKYIQYSMYFFYKKFPDNLICIFKKMYLLMRNFNILIHMCLNCLKIMIQCILRFFLVELRILFIRYRTIQRKKSVDFSIQILYLKHL
jgi:hypothetical protein